MQEYYQLIRRKTVDIIKIYFEMIKTGYRARLCQPKGRNRDDYNRNA